MKGCILRTESVVWAAWLGLVACASEEAELGTSDQAEVTALPTLPSSGIVDTEAESGWSQGHFSVSDDGAAEYDFPLWVPDGRRNFQPNLTLHYNSNAGDGPLGVGWSIVGLSTIVPCSRTQATDIVTNYPPYFSGNDVAYCMDGRRLRQAATNPGPNQREFRLEKDDYTRIVATVTDASPILQPTSFKAWTKDGQILTFGARMQAYLLSGGSDPENPAFVKSPSRVTAAWALSRIEDRNGNQIDIAYDTIERSAQRWAVEFRPKQITYAPDRKIEFVYEVKNPKVDTYRAGLHGGVHTIVWDELTAIKMWTGTELAREYRLNIGSGSITQRAQLKSIQECDGVGVCFVPVAFEWSTGYGAPAKHYDFNVVDTNVTDVADAVSANSRYIVADIDGDGKDDLFYQRNDLAADWYMRKSTGTGFGAAQSTGIENAVASSQGFPIYHPTYRVLDYDDDGKMDILVETDAAPGANTKWTLYRSTGTSFAAYGNDYFDDHYSGGGPGTARGAFFADLNGDGLVDYVGPYRFPGDTKLTWRYRLGTGTGFAAFTDTGFEFGDVNNMRSRAQLSDGVMRIVASDVGETRYRSLQFLSGQIGFEYPDLPYTKLPENQDRSNLRFADVNGDGNPDAIYPYSGLKVQLGSGNGFSELIPGPPEYVDPASPSDGNERGVRIVDFNNDGAVDVLVLHPGTPTSLTDEAHGVQGYTWVNGAFVRIPMYDVTAIPSGTAATAHVQVGDFNGDGMVDLAQRWTGSPNFLRLLMRKGITPDKIIRIKGIAYDPLPGALSDPGGAPRTLHPQIEIDYTTLADRAHHTPCTGATYPVKCPTRGGSIVAKHRVATGDATTPWHEVTHTYAGMRSDTKGRGALGVDSHTATALGGAVKTVTSYEKNTVTKALATPGRYAYPFTGLATKIVDTVIDGGRTYERTRVMDYTARTGTVADTYDVVPKSSGDSDREKPNGGSYSAMHSWTKTVDTVDAFGNVTKTTTTVPGSDRVTLYTYNNDTTNWLIGQLTRRSATDCLRPSNVCETRTIARAFYPTTGNLKEVVIEPDDRGALFLRTSLAYEAFGNLDTVTWANTTGATCTADAQCATGQVCVQGLCGQQRTTAFGYDAAGLYLKSVTNDLGHSTQVNVHSGLGVPLDSWDANGVQTTRKFDRFGRLREVNTSDGYFERYTHPTAIESVTTAATGGGATAERARVILDKLGRPIERRTLAFDGSVSSTTMQYDKLGRVHKISRPFIFGSSDPIYYTAFNHDLRGRLTSVVDPDGATTNYVYTGLRTDVTDPERNPSYTLERGDGRLGSSNDDDPESAGWLPTSYEYAPFGQLSKVTAPDNTDEVMTYDRRGRLFEHTDASAGKTTTTFNGFGEVTQEVNGADETTTFGYDTLGRSTVVTSPDGITTSTWDPPNQKGKLGSTLSPDGVTVAYGYDEIGRGTSTTWTVEGTAYRIDVQYDDVGRLYTLAYPAFPGVTRRLRVKYKYTPTGYLSQVEDTDGGASYWAVTDRNAAGQLEAETFGEGATAVTGARTYYPMTGMLESLRVDGPSGQLDGIHYTYDFNRNVTQRHDQFGTNAKIQGFTYDALDRLLTWSVSGGSGTPFTDTFDYSAGGNLTSETFAGRTGADVTYRYDDAAHPHRLTSTSRSATPYTYDLAGRQRTGPNRAHTFNRFNLPKMITRGGQTTTLAYDAAGRRVLKRGPNQTVITLAQLFERRVGSDAKNVHYIAADRRTVAQLTLTQATPTSPTTTSELLSLHSDRQGSIIQTTSATGAVVDEFFFDPFGRRTDRNYAPLSPQVRPIREGYTGHVHDDELDLINMRGRLYDPATRRFLTPDPIVDPLSSQGHNRYSYVHNNPATRVDPSGFEDCAEEVCLEEGGGGGGGGTQDDGPGAPTDTGGDESGGVGDGDAEPGPGSQVDLGGDEPAPPTGTVTIGPINQDPPPPPPPPPPTPPPQGGLIIIPWGPPIYTGPPNPGGSLFGQGPLRLPQPGDPTLSHTICPGPRCLDYMLSSESWRNAVRMRNRRAMVELKILVLMACAGGPAVCAVWGPYAAGIIEILDCYADGPCSDDGEAEGSTKFKTDSRSRGERREAKYKDQKQYLDDLEEQREDMRGGKRWDGNGDTIRDTPHPHATGEAYQDWVRSQLPPGRGGGSPRVPRVPRGR